MLFVNGHVFCEYPYYYNNNVFQIVSMMCHLPYLIIYDCYKTKIINSKILYLILFQFLSGVMGHGVENITSRTIVQPISSVLISLFLLSVQNKTYIYKIYYITFLSVLYYFGGILLVGLLIIKQYFNIISFYQRKILILSYSILLYEMIFDPCNNITYPFIKIIPFHAIFDILFFQYFIYILYRRFK